jgi:hypothetical protein
MANLFQHLFKTGLEFEIFKLIILTLKQVQG